MVKYKLEIIISSEEFFNIAARYLPFELLDVEEIGPSPPTAVIAKTPKLREPSKPRKPPSVVSLGRGTTKIVMKLFADGEPHRPVELRPLFKAAGFSPMSISSRLDTLQRYGVLDRVGDGRWILKSSPELSRIATGT